MTDIAGFSEAARLYAVNEPVVLAMAEHLKADAAKFWEAVEAPLPLHVPSEDALVERPLRRHRLQHHLAAAHGTAQRQQFVAMLALSN